MRQEISRVALLALGESTVDFLVKFVGALLLLLGLALGDFLFDAEAGDVADVAASIESKEDVVVFLISVESAANSSEVLPADELVDADELALLDPV